MSQSIDSMPGACSEDFDLNSIPMNETCAYFTSCPASFTATGSFLYSLYSCSSGPLAFLYWVMLVLLLIACFMLMKFAADYMFEPVLTEIVEQLHIPHRFAAATLLAMGNGAPDVMSTIAAINKGQWKISLGSLIGASIFINTVVLGSILYNSSRERLRMSIAAIREKLAFLGSVILLLLLFTSGQINRAACWLCLGLFVLYIALILVSDLWHQRGRPGEAGLKQMWLKLWVADGSGGEDLILHPILDGDAAADGAELDEVPSPGAAAPPQLRDRHLDRLDGAALSSHSAAHAERLRALHQEKQYRMGPSENGSEDGAEADGGEALLANGSDSPAATVDLQAGGGAGVGTFEIDEPEDVPRQWAWGWASRLEGGVVAALEEMVADDEAYNWREWRSRECWPWWWFLLVLLSLPGMLVMRLTTVAVGESQYSAPLMACSVALGPVVSYWLLQGGDVQLWVALLLLAVGLVAGSAWALQFGQRARCPKLAVFGWAVGFYLLCFLGLAQTLLWINYIADLLVDCLAALGLIGVPLPRRSFLAWGLVRIPGEIMGLFPLAMGNSLGDFFSNAAVAKGGHELMALTACFVGPIFNILLGLGGGFLSHLNSQHLASIQVFVPPAVWVGAICVIANTGILLASIALRSGRDGESYLKGHPHLAGFRQEWWRSDYAKCWGMYAVYIVVTAALLFAGALE